MQISNYAAEIKINGTTVPDWSGFEVSTRVGDAEINFSVDLGRPINVGSNDTISIRDGLGTDLYYLVENKKIEGNSGNFQQFRLTGAGSTISRNSPNKHIIYINEAWLSEIARGYYFRDGIVYYKNPGTTPLKRNGVSVDRLLVEGLPGKDIKDIEFECIIQSGITHHDVARDLASRCGLSVVQNTPNPSIQKTMFVSSQGTYWEAISRIFSLWNPMIFIKGTVIYVVDSGKNSQVKPSANNLVFTEDSFQGYEWRIDRTARIIDHILVTGPSTRYTYTASSKDIKKISHTENTLSGDDETEQYESIITLDLSTKVFQYLTLNKHAPKREVRTLKKKVDPLNPDNKVTVQEVKSTYNYDDDLFHQITIDYKYASYSIPIGSVTTEYALIGKVAGGISTTYTEGSKQELPAVWEWTKIRETTVVYDDFLEGTSQVETTETTNALVVYEKVQDTDDEGDDVDSNEWPREITMATLTQGFVHCEENDESGYGYHTEWMFTQKKITRFDIASPNLLKKNITLITMCPAPMTRFYSEDIPLPNRSNRRRTENQRKWEFFNVGGVTTLINDGDPMPSGTYHPRYEVANPDITTSDQATQIADRYFKARSSSITEISIKTSIPLFGSFVGGTLTIPTCTKRFFNWNTKLYENITIVGGTYWITGQRRICNYKGEVGSSSRELEVHDVLEIKSYF